MGAVTTFHRRNTSAGKLLDEKFDDILNFPEPKLHGQSTRWPKRTSKAFVLIAIILLLLSWREIIIDLWSQFSRHHAPNGDGPGSIHNSTLGFQDIFVLSIPDRSDRRAPLLAGANATNLTITIIDAVRDKQVLNTDWPETWGTDGWEPAEGELGCFMSHVRTWRKMIQENITSSLIMESDVDWDMRIKQAMTGVAQGTQAIADWPFEEGPATEASDGRQHPKDISIPTKPPVSPYGDKWDLIWLGHCGSAADGDGRVYSFNDSSAPDKEHAWAYGPRPADDQWQSNTRVVYHLQETVCTTAYAISNQGARKLDALLRQANSPIDIKMWEVCTNNSSLACIGVYPQVISMAESRTNIKHSEGGLSFGYEIMEERIVAGKGIQVSSRVNANLGLANEGPDGWKWEWASKEEQATESVESQSSESSQ